MAPHRKIAVMVIVGVAHSICTGIDEGTHWMTETKSRRLERRLHSFASIREQERRSHSLEFKNELRLQREAKRLREARSPAARWREMLGERWPMVDEDSKAPSFAHFCARELPESDGKLSTFRMRAL